MLKTILSETSSWQDALSDLITDVEDLIAELELEPWRDKIQSKIFKPFGLRVTKSYVARMTKANPLDPLLLQVLPNQAEYWATPGFDVDPLKEREVNPVPGLLHKYPKRVLVTLTGACAIHCRYCFRRHFDYANNITGTQGWEKIFSYIHSKPTIDEVILSGGDPLVVPDHLLAAFLEQLSKIKHIKRVRIHTRMPVVLPARITPELVSILKQFSFIPVVVIHVNHAQEINDEVASALTLLRKEQIYLLNQSVVLKNINDDAQVLSALSHALFQIGVQPYYLHVLDKVAGSAHFEVDLARIKTIYSELMTLLPGYLIPKLVQEEPGKLSKTFLSTGLITS